jgi:Tfp pilus assembly protein PilV
MQRPARTRLSTRRARVSRFERGDGFDADAGFTIVEVVVAATLLLVAFVAAAGLFEEGTKVSGDTRQRVVAAQLASAAIEKVRGPAADPARFTTQVVPGETITTQTVNGLKFTLTQDMQWVNQTATTSACDSGGTGSNAILQVSESVTWPGAGATAPVQSTTALAPPAGAYSAATGSIGVKVLNAAGLPSVNTAVTIAGPMNQTQNTTAEGCAFFAYLTPGAYTASVTAGTGVGDQEVLIPTQATSVTVGQTASLTFNYDTAATITITGWAKQTATAAAATGIRVGVDNTSLQPYGQYSWVTGTTTLTPLFPYPAGYTVFAGNCTDSDPNGLDTSRNRYYVNPGTTPVTVTPGGTVSTTVPLYDLPITVMNGATPAVGATLTATETSGYSNPQPPATPVCTASGGSGPLPTIGLVTSVTGGISLTEIPLGHWTINATFGTKHGTVKIWRRITGVFNVTATGTSTGSALSTVTVAVS